MYFVHEIVNHIVRPSREEYHNNRLGSKIIDAFSLKSNCYVRFVRSDETILNLKNQKIQISYYSSERANPQNCVIYLHTNNGSRLQGLDYLRYLFARQLNVCLLDFSGSGMSEGKYVTLGLNESNDLQVVIQHLKRQKMISNVVLWGRSMGAVTALIYASKYQNIIRGLVLDSPFKDLNKLIKELASMRTGLPKIFFEPLLYFIRSQILEKTELDIDSLKIKHYLQSESFTNIPALFLVSKNDKLVPPHHTQKLFTRYKCPQKYLKYIEIQHHQNRQKQIIEHCAQFVDKIFMNIEFKNHKILTKNNSKGTLNQSKMQNSSFLLIPSLKGQNKMALSTQKSLNQFQRKSIKKISLSSFSFNSNKSFVHNQSFQ